MDEFDETTGFLGASQKTIDSPMEESPPKASPAFPAEKQGSPLAGQKKPVTSQISQFRTFKEGKKK